MKSFLMLAAATASLAFASSAFAATYNCTPSESSDPVQVTISADGSTITTDSSQVTGSYKLVSQGKSSSTYKGSIVGKEAKIVRQSVLKVSNKLISGAQTGSVDEDGSSLSCGMLEQ